MRLQIPLRAIPFLLIVLLAVQARAGTPADADVTAHVDLLEGVFYGEDNTTPYGPMPMAFHFQREEDGSLHAAAVQDANTWIDLRLHREDGRWLLTEAAAMEGLGVQRYTLGPVSLTGDEVHWQVAGQEEFMTVITRVTQLGLEMDVTLGGKPHVTFRLPRMTGPAAEAVAAQLAKTAHLLPTESR